MSRSLSVAAIETVAPVVAVALIASIEATPVFAVRRF